MGIGLAGEINAPPFVDMELDSVDLLENSEFISVERRSNGVDISLVIMPNMIPNDDNDRVKLFAELENTLYPEQALSEMEYLSRSTEVCVLTDGATASQIIENYPGLENYCTFLGMDASSNSDIYQKSADAVRENWVAKGFIIGDGVELLDPRPALITGTLEQIVGAMDPDRVDSTIPREFRDLGKLMLVAQEFGDGVLSAVDARKVLIDSKYLLEHRSNYNGRVDCSFNVLKLAGMMTDIKKTLFDPTAGWDNSHVGWMQGAVSEFRRISPSLMALFEELDVYDLSRETGWVEIVDKYVERLAEYGRLIAIINHYEEMLKSRQLEKYPATRGDIRTYVDDLRKMRDSLATG